LATLLRIFTTSKASPSSSASPACSTSNDRFIQSIDPPARLRASGYAQRGLDDILADLERQRGEHVVWLTNLTAEQLDRVGEHDSVGEIRVVDIAHQWAAHDMAHLRQMALLIQQYLAPLMGRTRGFYDV
jgi:hypothetical protein